MLKALTVQQIEGIISAAERLNAKYPPSEHGISLTDPHALDDVISYANDSIELKREIKGLSHDARMELMALMWIGRDREENDFNAAVEHDRKNSDAGDVEYIAEKAPSLPLYLREGMKKADAT
jgi:Protein of unknown function (DUF3775)